MLLHDFSGGVNTRIAPHLLPPTQAQKYVNIDNASGALKSLKGPISTGIPVNKYFTYFYADNEWVSKSNETDFVEYQDNLYMSDGTTLKYRKNLVESTLGIIGPSSKLTIGATLNLPLTTNITQSTGGTLVTGTTYNYVVGIFDAAGQAYYYKEIPYTINAVDKELTKILTFTFSAVTTGTYTIKLYREVSGTYYLVGSTSYTEAATIVDDKLNISTNEVIPDTYSTNLYTYCYTFYDSVNGVESTPCLPSIEAGTIDIQLTGFEATTDTKVTTIRIYRNGGALTNYTLIKEIPYTNPVTVNIPYISDIDIAGNHILDSFNNYAPISGLKYITEAYAMLFAAKGDKLYYSDIAKPYAWPKTNFLDFDATITGIGAVSNGLLVFTKYKTFIITGNSPSTFSKYILSSAQGCLSHKSIQFVDNNLLWLSSDGICSTNGGQIKVLSMPIIGKLDFLVNVYSAAILDNVYYLSYSNALGDKLLVLDFRYNLCIRYIDTQGSHIIATRDNIYQDYNGTLQKLLYGADLEFTYKSPVLTEGKYSNYKTYKDMYIKYNGVFTIKVYIDRVLNTTVTLNGNDVYNLKFQGLSKGYGLEIEITGTGEIEEIEYNVIGRQNGK